MNKKANTSALIVLAVGFGLLLALNFVDFSGLTGITGSLVLGDGTSSNCSTYVNESSTLAGNITGCSGTGLFINSSNLTLDCQGSSIIGTETGAGINISGQTNVTISNCILVNFTNGILADGSNVTLINNTVQGNEDMLMTSSELNMTNSSFLNPSGTLDNYTVLSIIDSDTGNYSINWTSAPLSFPANHSSFANKFVQIHNTSGSVSIDNIAWSWNQSEASGYNEFQFELWTYNGTDWTMLNDTPDTTNNIIGFSNLVPASTYGILQDNSEGASNITFPNSLEFFMNYNESYNETLGVLGEIINVTWLDAGAGYWYNLSYSNDSGATWHYLNYTNLTYFAWQLNKSFVEGKNYTLNLTVSNGITDLSSDVSDSQFWIGNCNVSPVNVSGKNNEYAWSDSHIIVCKNRKINFESDRPDKNILFYNSGAMINVTVFNISDFRFDGRGIVIKNSIINTSFSGKNISASDSFIAYFTYVTGNGTYEGINNSKDQYKLFTDGYMNVSNMSSYNASAVVQNNLFVYLVANNRANITNSWLWSISTNAKAAVLFINNTYSRYYWLYAAANDSISVENVTTGVANEGNVAYSGNGFNLTVSNFTFDSSAIFLTYAENITSHILNSRISQVMTGNNSNNSFYNSSFSFCFFGSSVNYFKDSVNYCILINELNGNAVLNFSNSRGEMPSKVLANTTATIFGDLNVSNKGKFIDWSVPANVTRYFPVRVLNSTGGNYSGANVTVYNKTNGIVWSGITDVDGLAEPNVTFTNFTYNDTYSIVVRGSVGHGNLSFFSDTPIIIQTKDFNQSNITYPNSLEFFTNYNETSLIGEVVNVTWTDAGAEAWYYLDYSNDSGTNWYLLNYTNLTYYEWQLNNSLINSINYKLRVTVNDGVINLTNDTSDSNFWIGQCNVPLVSSVWNINNNVTVCKNRRILLPELGASQLDFGTGYLALVNVNWTKTNINGTRMRFTGNNEAYLINLSFDGYYFNLNVYSSQTTIINSTIQVLDRFMFESYYKSSVLKNVAPNTIISDLVYVNNESGFVNITNSTINRNIQFSTDVSANVSNSTLQLCYSNFNYENMSINYVDSNCTQQFNVGIYSPGNYTVKNLKSGSVANNVPITSSGGSVLNLSNSKTGGIISLGFSSAGDNELLDSNVSLLFASTGNVSVYNATISGYSVFSGYDTHVFFNESNQNTVHIVQNATLNFTNSTVYRFIRVGFDNILTPYISFPVIYGDFNITNKTIDLWYVDAIVTRYFPIHVLNKTFGNYSGANVSIYNSTGGLVASALTDANGWVNIPLNFTNTTFGPGNFSIMVKGSIGYGNISFTENTPIIIQADDPPQSNITYPNSLEFFTNYNESGQDTGDVINVTWTNSGLGVSYYLDYSANGSNPPWNNIVYTDNTSYLWNISKSLGINESTNYTLRITSSAGTTNGTSDTSDSNFWIGNCNVSPVTGANYFNWGANNVVVCKSRNLALNSALPVRQIAFNAESALINISSILNVTYLYFNKGIIIKNSNISCQIEGTNITASDSLVSVFNYPFNANGTYDGFNYSKNQYLTFPNGYINFTNFSNDGNSITISAKVEAYQINITNSLLGGISAYSGNGAVNLTLINSNFSGSYFMYLSSPNVEFWIENLSNSAVLYGNKVHGSNDYNLNTENAKLNNIYLQLNYANTTNHITNSSVQGMYSSGSNVTNYVQNSYILEVHLASDTKNFFNGSIVDHHGLAYIGGSALLNFSNTTWAMPGYVNLNSNVTMYGNFNVSHKGWFINWSVPANVTRYFPVYVNNSLGNPEVGANVSVYNSTGSLVWFGVTDAEGLAYPNVTFTNFTYNNSYNITVRGSVGYGNLSFFSDTPIIIQTGDVNISVNITSPQDNIVYNSGTNFQLYANISNSGDTNATNCNATIIILNESIVNITSTESKIHILGNVAPGSISETWNLTALNSGIVNITVNVSCDLGIFANDTVHNITVFAGEAWPMFHYDLARTGYTNNTAPDDIKHSIIYTAGGGMSFTSPAVAGGYVYMGNLDHKVYQLNASDVSQQIATFTTGGDIYSSPAVANGYVYVGNDDNRTYQLNASTLAYVSNYTTGGRVFSSPVVSGGYVYVGSEDGKVYQLNASNISRLVNIYDEGHSIYSSPAVVGGYVYVGSLDSVTNTYGKVYQLNASNISVLVNSYNAGSGFLFSPVVSGGYVYIGSFGNGRVYQLNASNVSQQITNYSTGSIIESSPAVAYGYVYIGSGNHKIEQLNASNISILVNSYLAGDSVYSSPAVAGGYLYVGSTDKNVYQLNASNVSRVVNIYATGGAVMSSPAVAGGYVYVGSGDNNVYQLGGEQTVNVTLNLPVNNYVFNNTGNINLNFTATGSDLVHNCSLYINGTLNQTNSSVLNNTLTNFNLNVTVGAYSWFVGCFDGPISDVSEIRTFYVNDTLPPVISNVVNTTTNETATVNWTTNESANSAVNYGRTLGLGSSASDVLFVINHSIDITGLDNNTLYYYNVTSCDVYGNCNTSGPFNFTTQSNAYVNLAPVVVLVEPLNQTQINNTNNIDLNFNVTDDLNLTLSCDLYINGAFNQTNLSVDNSTLTNFVVPVVLGAYNWSVNCTDGSLSDVSETWYFTVNDTLPPVISNIVNTTTNDSATVNWTTNESADSNLNYGVSLGLGSGTGNAVFVITHSIWITGLDNNTLYYYNITSCDPYDNCATVGPYNFTTLQHNVTNISDLPPTITSLGCAPNPAYARDYVVCRANVFDDNEIGNVTANVTKPDSARRTQNPICAGTNTSKTCSFTFSDTDRIGTYNVLWSVNDTGGNSDTASSSFEIRAATTPESDGGGGQVGLPKTLGSFEKKAGNITPPKEVIVSKPVVPPVPVPPQVSPVVEKPGKVEFTFPYWIVLVLIAVIILPILFFLVRHEKKKKPKFVGLEKGVAEYITKSREASVSDLEIRTNLINAEWDEKLVDSVFNKLK